MDRAENVLLAEIILAVILASVLWADSASRKSKEVPDDSLRNEMDEKRMIVSVIFGIMIFMTVMIVHPGVKVSWR